MLESFLKEREWCGKVGLISYKVSHPKKGYNRVYISIEAVENQYLKFSKFDLSK